MLMIIFRFVTVGANIESKSGKLTICPFFFFQFNISHIVFKIRLPPRQTNLHSFNDLIIVACQRMLKGTTSFTVMLRPML